MALLGDMTRGFDHEDEIVEGGDATVKVPIRSEEPAVNPSALGAGHQRCGRLTYAAPRARANASPRLRERLLVGRSPRIRTTAHDAPTELCPEL
jgi:hypothetical protein